MNLGMLWFDDSQRTLQQKIIRAAAYYSEKYRQTANVVYLNPAMNSERLQSCNGIAIRESHYVLNHHFWIGREKNEQT